MILRPRPSPIPAEEYGRPDKVLDIVSGTQSSIILEDGPLAAGPRPMDVLDRCGAFRLPALSTQHTYKPEKGGGR